MQPLSILSLIDWLYFIVETLLKIGMYNDVKYSNSSTSSR